MSTVVDPWDDYDSLSKRKQRKVRLRKKFENLLKKYKNVISVSVDNVGSNQMQNIRGSLRGKAEILMGKNTLLRMVLRDRLPEYEALLPFVVENMGFVFTNDNVKDIRDVLLSNKQPAAAKSGVIAPVNVTVPPGPTGMDPGQTSFFQALQIPTKISRGAIEITAPVLLIRAGEKVSASAVALLSKLNIKPFFYGMKAIMVSENGSIYDAKVLDLTEADLKNKFYFGVRTVAAVSLEIGIPTAASIPHSMINAFRKIAAIALEAEYSFKQLDELKEAGASSGGSGGGGDSGAAEEAPKEEEPEEEESDSDLGGGGLFGDDSDSD